MNFNCSCNLCFLENNTRLKQYNVEINADLFGVLKCDFGHSTLINISHHLFDVLFQSGIQSYIKNCLSESVMSFAASLERTYEFYIKISLNNKGLTFKEIDNFWKEISRQSERQYGSFCGLYFLDNKERWMSNTNQVNFRNKIIHNGYIATSDEVIAFGQYCLEKIEKILSITHKSFSKETAQLYFHNNSKLENQKSKLIRELNINHSSTLFISGGLNWQSEKGIPKTFEECIKNMKGILSINEKINKHLSN